MTTSLSLDTFEFTAFEIPETLPLGGAQVLAEHKLPGGLRVIDAMGQDEADISWSGRFRGANAAIRARWLDTLRVQGRSTTLFAGAFVRQVVVRSFKYELQRDLTEIPYTITLAVVKNEDHPITEVVPSSEALVGQDVSSVTSLGSAFSTLSSSLSTLSTAYAAYRSVKNGNYAAVSTLLGSATTLSSTLSTATGSTAVSGLSSALSDVASAAKTARSALAPAMSVAGLLSGSGGTSALTTASTAFSSYAALSNIAARATRAVTNLV